MPRKQIWSCHMSQVANFKKNYFALILHLMLEKVTKFPVQKLGRGEPHPSIFRVKVKDLRQHEGSKYFINYNCKALKFLIFKKEPDHKFFESFETHIVSFIPN